MGCSTCKQKKENNPINGIDMPDVDLIPKSFSDGDFSGNVLFKIIAFVVVILAIPFIILVLIGQIFFTFFAPKKLPKITKKLKGTLKSIVTKYAKFKYNREMRKRQKQFGENKGYHKDSDLVDIEILDGIKVHENNKKK